MSFWTKPRNIMLATDLTPASDWAFDRAIHLAAEWSASLILCHVVMANSMRPWGIDLRMKMQKQRWTGCFAAGSELSCWACSIW
jgi:hypothetical protein